jgi:uncharacterized protein (DUF305 family)
VLAGILVGALLAACGGVEPPPGRDTERAFLQSMVPHDTSSVGMARVAEQEARSRFVKDLARHIRASQTSEIRRMGPIHLRLFGRPLEPDPTVHDRLGLTAQQAGTDSLGGEAMLRGRRPFDRAFVDEMVPHHRGAIAMAMAVLAKSQDDEIRSLARTIVTTRQDEIARMEAFREREYGGRAPG